MSSKAVPEGDPSVTDTSVSSSVAGAEFHVTGMHCGSCVALIQDALIEREGVVSASVDLDSERASVRFVPSAVSLEDLAAIVEDAGYGATAL